MLAGVAIAAPQGIEAGQQIAAHLLALQQVALAEQHRQGAAQRQLAEALGLQQQMGQARLQT